MGGCESTVCTVIEASCRGLAQALGLTVVGGFAARQGVLNKPEILRALGRMATGFYIPALIYSNLSEGATPELLRRAAMLPLAGVLLSVLGFVIGFSLCLLPPLKRQLAANPALYRQVLVGCSVGNSGTLPLVVTSALVRDSEAWKVCVRYIFLFNIGGQVAIWLGVYNYLKRDLPPPAALPDEEELGQRVAREMAQRSGSGVELETSESFATTVDAYLSGDEGGVADAVAVYEDASAKWWQKWLATLRALVNPPMVATILGLITGLTPIRELLVPADRPLGWLHQGITTLGWGSVPVVMSLLGAQMHASLVGGAGVRLPRQAVLVVCGTRMGLLPALGCAVGYCLRTYGYMSDPYLRLVLLIQFCTPTANQVVAILTQLNYRAAALSGAVIYQYAAAIPVFIIYFSLCLWLSEVHRGSDAGDVLAPVANCSH
eukprot:TRINITY_DN5805_c0_g1_i3.p1 TRINITY_DN5805_c0_g1~~TRINITY_DN5805_c0_g1_i3.p1  ORF type:complete len:457 (+),score=116.66 TRINITY_DN5805_c0_g1_i3:74-1372(+)